MPYWTLSRALASLFLLQCPKMRVIFKCLSSSLDPHYVRWWAIEYWLQEWTEETDLNKFCNIFTVITIDVTGDVITPIAAHNKVGLRIIWISASDDVCPAKKHKYGYINIQSLGMSRPFAALFQLSTKNLEKDAQFRANLREKSWTGTLEFTL